LISTIVISGVILFTRAAEYPAEFPMIRTLSSGTIPEKSRRSIISEGDGRKRPLPRGIVLSS